MENLLFLGVPILKHITVFLYLQKSIDDKTVPLNYYAALDLVTIAYFFILPNC